jgi:DNA polymerase-1
MVRIIATDLLEPDSKLSSVDSDWVYNGLDCCVTLEVLQKLRPQLDNVSSQTYSFSRELQGPIFEMMTRGIRIDKNARKAKLDENLGHVKLISDQLDAIIKDGIGIANLNWRSPSQLNKLLYDVLGLPPVKKRSASGAFTRTVDKDALEKLSYTFLGEPICSRILLLRKLMKQVEFLTSGIDLDGRARTGLNIAGTNTGRLSSSTSIFGTGRNQQNVDRSLRIVFIADPGMKFVNIDLAQGDARNVGAVCWDRFVEQYGSKFAGSYLDACESGDLHTTVCRMAWQDLDWPEDKSLWKKVAEQIAHEQDSYRQLAKKLGHGTNYYGTPPTMAKHTKTQRNVIELFQRRYFEAFPCIPMWHNLIKTILRTDPQPSITTLLRRRRHFFGRRDDDTTLRAAIAYEPQSLTGDEINTGMLALFRWQQVQLLLQVHDSLLIQIPEDREEELVPQIVKLTTFIMELKQGRQFIVPCEAKTGWNWGDVQYNEDGTVKANEFGMKEWKGKDNRKRPQTTLRDIL